MKTKPKAKNPKMPEREVGHSWLSQAPVINNISNTVLPLGAKMSDRDACIQGTNTPIPTPAPTEVVLLGLLSPRRSMVSLILLAAFSLSSPGWLLLMEKSVITPVVWGHNGQG